MTLFDRIALLIKADAHAVIESMEERTLLLKQYLREAEMAVDRKHARLEAVREDEKRLRQDLARQEDEVRRLDDDIRLAMAGGKEDLARFAVRRIIPRQDDVRALREQIAHLEREAQALAERLAVQQQQLDSLRVRVRTQLARQEDTGTGPWPGDAVVPDEAVELELLRRRQAEGGAR